MLDSTILDVVLGLIFIFLAVSLAAGAAMEAVASMLKLRSTTLLAGVKDLLNDQNFSDLAAELYSHALINPRGPGMSNLTPPAAGQPAHNLQDLLAAKATAIGRQLSHNLQTNLPAYIEPQQFATALMDLLSLVHSANGPPTIAQLQAAVNARVPAETHPQINQLINGAILRAGGDLAAIRTELSNWFDNAMDRVSSAYKRHTQVFVFVAALAISAVINVDAIHVGQRVWAQPSLVANLKVGQTVQKPEDLDWALAKTLPLGWPNGFLVGTDAAGGPVPLRGENLALAMLGWLITALASLYGAPFWFDALQRIVRLKGAGPSPDEKADKTAAAS